MKTLMLFIALTASVWSSFVFSQENIQGYRFGSGSISISYCLDGVIPSGKSRCIVGNGPYNVSGNVFRSVESLYSYAGTKVIRSSGVEDEIPFNTSSYRYNYTSAGCTNCVSISIVTGIGAPLDTCYDLEGAFIDGYHNSESDFCAVVGNTGGPTPQPLMCTATMIAEIPAFSGNFQHIVTANACSAPTGPTAPDDGTDPGEPCTENCEPTDPETPPGSGDGSDIPGTGDGPTGGNTTVGGTITDSQGNVTNINLTMDQDFSPITNRLNETNERLKLENKNSASMDERLKQINQNIVDGNLELKDINSHMKEGLSGIEGKLDGIKEGIDGIKDGMGTAEEGEAAADGISLPDYQRTIDNGFGDITGAINSDDNNQKEGQLLNFDENLRAFSSVPALFDFAADNCQPVSFGSNIILDLCPYAATSSGILSWVLTVLTIIFLIHSISADIKKIRMS